MRTRGRFKQSEIRNKHRGLFRTKRNKCAISRNTNSREKVDLNIYIYEVLEFRDQHKFHFIIVIRIYFPGIGPSTVIALHIVDL